MLTVTSIHAPLNGLGRIIWMAIVFDNDTLFGKYHKPVAWGGFLIIRGSKYPRLLTRRLSSGDCLFRHFHSSLSLPLCISHFLCRRRATPEGTLTYDGWMRYVHADWKPNAEGYCWRAGSEVGEMWRQKWAVICMKCMLNSTLEQRQRTAGAPYGIILTSLRNRVRAGFVDGESVSAPKTWLILNLYYSNAIFQQIEQYFFIRKTAPPLLVRVFWDKNAKIDWPTDRPPDMYISLCIYIYIYTMCTLWGYS